MQTHDVIEFMVRGDEFSGQTTFVQHLAESSHLNPSLQLHKVFSLFGDEFTGHSWHTLLIKIDFEEQTHFPFSRTSFFPHKNVQTPLRFT